MKPQGACKISRGQQFTDVNSHPEGKKELLDPNFVVPNPGTTQRTKVSLLLPGFHHLFWCALLVFLPQVWDPCSHVGVLSGFIYWFNLLKLSPCRCHCLGKLFSYKINVILLGYPCRWKWKEGHNRFSCMLHFTERKIMGVSISEPFIRKGLWCLNVRHMKNSNYFVISPVLIFSEDKCYLAYKKPNNLAMFFKWLLPKICLCSLLVTLHSPEYPNCFISL